MALVAPLLALCAYSCNSGPDARVDVAPAPVQDPVFNIDDDLLAGDPNPPQNEQCQEESRAAVTLGLDIYLMLDSSLSMDDLLPASLSSGSQTKWEAVQDALRTFIAAESTDEIGLGLQYFPQVAPGVPFSCNTNDDCGASGGACSNSLCVASDTGQLGGRSVSLLSAASDEPVSVSALPGSSSALTGMMGTTASSEIP